MIVFDGIFTTQICCFRWNFSFPDWSFSMEFGRFDKKYHFFSRMVPIDQSLLTKFFISLINCFQGRLDLQKMSFFFLAENICSLSQLVVFEELFLISLIGRFQSNFRVPRSVIFDGIWGTILCLHISYLNNFPALHAGQTKNRFFAEDIWAYVFSDAPPLTKNVVFDGIWGN